MPKISVIIPVYNAEKYLKECIDSVLNQTFDDFEVLIINDGSTDESGKICDEYAQKDARVKVFHKENGGVSSARNLGLDNAKGEWITFVDSDDYISEDYFQPILKYCEQDYIIVNSHEILGDKKTVYRSFDSQTLVLDDFLNQYNLYNDFATPWAKFFKKEIILNNKIRFNEKLSRSEDVIFNLEYIIHCKSIGISSKTSYNYRRVPGSLSHKNVNLMDAEYIYTHIYSLLKAYFNNPEFISRHSSYSTMRYFFTTLYSNLNKKEKKQILKKLIKKHKKQLLKSVEGQRIHLIPVKWLIHFELINSMIFLAKINFQK